MDEKAPLDNTPLTTMLAAGGLLVAAGAAIWVLNTDFGAYASRSESDPTGQAIGAALALAGTLLVTMGWAAAAVCRQIADTAGKPADREET